MITTTCNLKFFLKKEEQGFYFQKIYLCYFDKVVITETVAVATVVSTTTYINPSKFETLPFINNYMTYMIIFGILSHPIYKHISVILKIFWREEHC